MRSMIDHAPRQLAPVTMAIVAVWLVSMGGTLPAPAQTQHAPAADAPSAEVPFGFKAYGVFSRMITERNYLAVVALKDAADGRATDAVGAVSGLRGEVSMIEGHLIVTYGVDCGAACPAATSETATLLATASAQNWRSVAIDKDLDAKATETFIRAQAKANGLIETKPFPFRINGAITDFVMHVNAAPNPRFKGHGSFDEMAVTGLAKGPRLAGSVVGFYAPPALQGVITHMGDFFHAHYVDAQRTATAHLDTFGIAAGSMLMLPKLD
jgi:acetolactate decarboxylase